MGLQWASLKRFEQKVNKCPINCQKWLVWFFREIGLSKYVSLLNCNGNLATLNLHTIRYPSCFTLPRQAKSPTLRRYFFKFPRSFFFILVFSTVFSKYVHYIILHMTGIEPRTSGICQLSHNHCPGKFILNQKCPNWEIRPSLPSNMARSPLIFCHSSND